MFVFGRPGAAYLEKVRSEQVPLKVTYGELGATRGALPAGYRHDRHVVDLGAGEDVYRRAIEGLRGWEAHRRAGLILAPVRPPVQEGQTVVLAISLSGISAIAACRIVYIVDEVDRFGFAYGTLPAHPEQGEESFLVQRDTGGTIRFGRAARWSRNTLPAECATYSFVTRPVTPIRCSGSRTVQGHLRFADLSASLPGGTSVGRADPLALPVEDLQVARPTGHSWTR